MKPKEVLKASAQELVEEVMRLQFENATLTDALRTAITARNRWCAAFILFGGIATWRVFGAWL